MATTTRKVGDLSPVEFAQRIDGRGLDLRLGPFDARITVHMPELFETLRQLYGHYPLLEGERCFSFHVQLRKLPRWAPWQASRVRFLVDGRAPHADMSAEHALAVLEWGINLVVSLRFHCFMMFHAAVVERNGRALLLPAAPGSGKTTLAAALINSGWRLLSDEFGLVRPGTGHLVPLPRPLPLKNESIDVLRRFAPQAKFGPLVAGTRKGDIVHLCPSAHCIAHAGVAVPAAWIVFPQWQPEATWRWEPVPRGTAFMSLAANAFNYELQGRAGFETVRDIVANCDAYALDYTNLPQAVDALTRLADGAQD
jgi:HprK-related kinase A